MKKGQFFVKNSEFFHLFISGESVLKAKAAAQLAKLVSRNPKQKADNNMEATGTVRVFTIEIYMRI